MQCPQCHAAVPAGSIFCPNCGSRLIQNTPNQYDSRFAPSSWPPQPQPAPQTHSMPPQPAPSQPTPRTHQRERGAAVAVKPLVIVLIIALVIAIPTTIYLLTSRHIFSNTSTTATNTSNNVFEPVEVTMPTDCLTNYWYYPYFNEDGSKLNTICANVESSGFLFVQDTTTNAIVDTIELNNTFTQDSLVYRLNSERILFLTAEPDADLNDDEEDTYYLTIIDINSNSVQNIYLGEGTWAYIYTNSFTNNHVYIKIHQTTQLDASGEGTSVILRVNLNTMQVEDKLSDSYSILGEPNGGSGVLLLTDEALDDYLHRTATLTLADWDDPMNESLWQTLNSELTFFGINLLSDGESIITRISTANSAENSYNSSETDTTDQLIIRQYDADTGTEMTSFTIPGFSSDNMIELYNADQSMLVVYEVGQSPNTFAVIDLDSMELISCYELDSDVLVGISPTNKSLYVVNDDSMNNDSTIQVVDLETGTITVRMNIPIADNAEDVSVGSIVISPDASFGYFTVNIDDQRKMYRFETDEQITIIDTISQWVAQNLTTTHLIIGGVTLAVVVAGGITAVIVIRRRKKATAASRNNIPAGSGNIPPTNGGFSSGNIHRGNNGL